MTDKKKPTPEEIEQARAMRAKEQAEFDKKSAHALNIIRDAYDKLMGRQFFYFNIASQFALKAVRPSLCPTMGVAHKDNVMWLVYNPEFIKYYDYNEISVILEHEICHFTYDHVKHFDSSNNARKVFKDEEEAKDGIREGEKQKFVHRIQNKATDRSINIYLFGLPNIRMSLGDIKRQYTDKEGNLKVQELNKYLVEAFENDDLWFKDSKMNLDRSKFLDKGGDTDMDKYGAKVLSLISKCSDDTILEANCITEDSFKRILKEAGYQPNTELKQLWKEMEDLKKSVGPKPSEQVVKQINADIKVKFKVFSKKQDEILYPKTDAAKKREGVVKEYGTWKYYFDLLMSCPKTEEAIKNIQDMDIHFGDDPGEDGEGSRDSQEAREKVLIEAARNSNKHDIPGDLREHLKSLFDKYSKEDTLPWNIILRRLVNASKKSIKRNDINSRNKYAPGAQILPGYKLDPIKSIAVIWDVSSSCMDEETQTKFISEVNMMIKAGSDVRVYYTDYDVEHVQDCKEKMKHSDYQITGGGGTCLDNGIKRAIADGYKILIQLSDNYMNFELTKKDLKGRRVINVCTTNDKQPRHYGPQIHVNRKK